MTVDKESMPLTERLRSIAAGSLYGATTRRIAQLDMIEAADLIDQLRKRVAEAERVISTNAEQLEGVRKLTAPLFKNVDPMPGDCMIGVNRTVTPYGYVRDVVKQLEAAKQAEAKLALAEQDARCLRDLLIEARKTYIPTPTGLNIKRMRNNVEFNARVDAAIDASGHDSLPPHKGGVD